MRMWKNTCKNEETCRKNRRYAYYKRCNVFPSQIEEVLLKIGGDITPNYQIIVGRENNTDTLEVQVEMSEGMLSDDVKSVAAIDKNIVAKLRSTLGLGAKVTLVEPKTITRSEGKAKRVIDNRKLHD